MLRKPLTTCLLLLFTYVASSQEIPSIESAEISRQLHNSKEIILAGQVLNYEKEKYPDLSVRVTLSSPNYFRKQIEKVKINDDGSFLLTSTEGYPYREVKLQLGDYYHGKVILHDGAKITLDMAQLSKQPIRFAGEGVDVEGPDGELSTFVNDYEHWKVEKRKVLQDEKLAVILDRNLSKSDKVEKLQKIYKKLSGVESSYAKKKKSKHLQWYLTNERVAFMYADILSVHWGKKMDDAAYREVTSFSPSTVSEATVQYYAFLGLYLGVTNRLETKLLTERTLRAQIGSDVSTESLNSFLREYNKKTDRLRYDKEIYAHGEKVYLDRYEEELISAKMDLQLKKIKKLGAGKASWVMLLAQPESLYERRIFVYKAKELSYPEWSVALGENFIKIEEKQLAEINAKMRPEVMSEPSLGIVAGMEDSYKSEEVDAISLLNSIKAFHPNEGVIIDIWVPWAEQCMMDLRESAELKSALDTLPLKMVYLSSSLEVTEALWERSIRDFPIKGTHVLLNSKLSADIMDLFTIRSYPYYIYIDSNGKVDPHLIKSLATFNVSKLEKDSFIVSDL